MQGIESGTEHVARTLHKQLNSLKVENEKMHKKRLQNPHLRERLENNKDIWLRVNDEKGRETGESEVLEAAEMEMEVS